MLGLQLQITAERLRFYVADAELPAADDLIAKLEGSLDHLEQRLVAAEERAEEEARRAEAAEARLREALAELERLEREPPQPSTLLAASPLG